MPFRNTYQGKRVLVTGHTGFKGSWLCEWLIALGADVTGFALPPATNPALFDQLGLSVRMHHIIGDVRDLQALRRVVEELRPEFVFHLAAQPLVRLSYEQPVETYATNVMGTVNVLEAIRLSRCACAVVVVTTDKCYENKEWLHSYREEDPLGGYDPYSSSKGAAELVIASYRRSYFSGLDSMVRLASARAGNVIGGGDWALDRIVPDCIRSLQRGEAIPVRNKIATRPWQHVLEPLSGYLWLGAQLAVASAVVQVSSSRTRPEHGIGTDYLNESCSGNFNLQLKRLKALSSSFNFGPALSSNRTVAELVEEILKHWPGKWEDKSDQKAVHEAKLLNLATDKAHHLLGWSPAWNFSETIRQTVAWHRIANSAGVDFRSLTRGQIKDYAATARAAGVAWAKGNR